MKISIIIPSYNQGQFIERTILSIVQQYDQSCEIILMDGGSDDGTSEVLKRYRDNLNVVISAPDNGQSDALQKGLEHATGDYVGWQNSDDIYLPGAFRTFREALARDQMTGKGADVYFGNQVIIDPADGVLAGKIFGPFCPAHFHFAGWNITNQSAFFSRECLVSSGGFDTKFHYGMDYDLFSRLILRGATFRWIDAYLGAFRLHAESKGANLHMVRITEYKQLRLRYVRDYDGAVPWESQLWLRKATAKARRLWWLIWSRRIFRAIRDKYFPRQSMLGDIVNYGS